MNLGPCFGLTELKTVEFNTQKLEFAENYGYYYPSIEKPAYLKHFRHQGQLIFIVKSESLVTDAVTGTA